MDDVAQGRISLRVAPDQFLFRATGYGISPFSYGDTTLGSGGESGRQALVETVDNFYWRIPTLVLESPG